MSAIEQAVATLRHNAGDKHSITVHMPDGGTLLYIGPEDQDVIGTVVASGAAIVQRRERDRNQRPLMLGEAQ